MTGMSSREQDLLARATDAESDLRHMREYVSSLRAEVLEAIEKPLDYMLWLKSVQSGEIGEPLSAQTYNSDVGVVWHGVNRLAALRDRLSSAPFGEDK